MTYAVVVKKLHQVLAGDAEYQLKHREAYSFINRMYRKFVRDRGRMEDHDLRDFLTAMCANGAAGYYRWQKQDDARAKFAEDVANQASDRSAKAAKFCSDSRVVCGTIQPAFCNLS